MEIGPTIIDLLGRKLRLGKWDLVPIFHLGNPEGYMPCMTRDRLTNQSIGLFESPDQTHYFIMILNTELKIWVRYEATFIEYLPDQDMRKIRV